MALPAKFKSWFNAKGWPAHPHQLEMQERAFEPATLHIAPTGGSKTMAGFLPTLMELDSEPRGPGPLDVLCQHILITACSGPFDADDLFREVITVGAYTNLSREDFDRCLDFCATGGYALRACDRWQRLVFRNDFWQLRDPRAAQRIRDEYRHHPGY